METTTHHACLSILLAPRLGGRRLSEWLRECGGPAALVARSDAELERLGLEAASIRALRQPDPARLEAGLAWLAQPGHHLLFLGAERYPPLLARIASPPAALFVQGDPDILWQPQIAIVGSRNPTAGGLDHARDFATELARQGLAVTSGLATGIDTAAHQAALAAGCATVAVTGTGLDRVYPRSNARLARRIARGGALVSEFPPGTPPRAAHFPSRNRIIAGLSLGVLVVEAGLNSGSLITAGAAAEQGREVFALPGSLHNPLARGCHRLIRQGAQLVESVSDILEALVPLAGELAEELRGQLAVTAGMSGTPAPGPVGMAAASGDPAGDPGEDPDYARLLAALGHDPVAIDVLVERSGLEARAVSSMLLLLELNGRVEKLPGGRVCRRA